MPVVGAFEVEDAGALDIERNVKLVGLLIEIVAGIGASVIAFAVVGATHVSADSDPVAGQLVPHPVGVQTNRNYWRLIRLHKRI